MLGQWRLTVWRLACRPDQHLGPGGDCVVAGDADSDGERADFGVLWDAVAVLISTGEE